MDWMRISLIILGIALIAGIWLAHRLRARPPSRDRHDEVADWGDDAVHIRAGGSSAQAGRQAADDARPSTGGLRDPLETPARDADVEPDRDEPRLAPSARGERREPRLGVTTNDDSADLGLDDGYRGDRVEDIYGVLDTEDESVPDAAEADARGQESSGSRRQQPAESGGRRPTEALAGKMAELGDVLSRLRPKRPLPGRSGDTVGETLDPDHEVRPELIEEPTPDMESLGESVSEPRVVGRNPRADAYAGEQKILLLHVVAPRNRPFTGVALGAAMRRAGMAPGAMDIYHFHEPESDARTPLFSAANMVAPGTLREEDLADMMTPGVTLFTQVHLSAAPQRAFDALLEHAHVLARDLGGNILDAQQSTATNQTLAYMREDMNDWLRRHRPDVLRRRSGS